MSISGTSAAPANEAVHVCEFPLDRMHIATGRWPAISAIRRQWKGGASDGQRTAGA